jgi:transcriptional regulator with XRE-family HTH domain
MRGAELKFHRLRMGLSTDDLARLLSVAVDTVDGWESGILSIQPSVRLKVLFGSLQLKYQEILCSPDALYEWEKWLERCLTNYSEI